ncbi:MAG: ATP-binding cassette domain-containing protein [Dorea sp.]|nr:ATP-binding cassette domain-containing protein [Dorea sp.]
MGQDIILDVKNLKKYFRVKNKKYLKAVDDVTFSVFHGETLGIVGESGCGKTTCGKTCMGMYRKTEGSVFYKGKDVHRMTKKERYEFSKEVQMIFQDPYTSLDPHLKIYDIIAEGIRIHKMASSKKHEESMVYELLEAVGLKKEHANRYVYEFSGGQRQRIGIARALAVNPELLVCDEPISALDVSIQSQIVNLLKKMKEERNLTILFIAHDVSMVRYISDRIIVMYLGQIVEMAEAEELCSHPFHPYTQALISAVPIPNPVISKEKQRIIMGGDVPSPIDPPQGCRFCTRCKYADERCRTQKMQLEEVSDGHFVSCIKAIMQSKGFICKEIEKSDL